MEGSTVFLIDQNRLPFEFQIIASPTYPGTAEAIRSMAVRGAPAIGAAAAFALAQAFLEAGQSPSWARVERARLHIEKTRPTARDLFFGTERVWAAAAAAGGWQEAVAAAASAARGLADDSVRACFRIGEVGQSLIPSGARILTHCNAGWLATVDAGTALAPVYTAAAAGKQLHVWVDETRPRAQGARLTAWELGNEGIPHHVIADNAAAFLMSRGEVDLVIVGADRIAANGDVVNKVGTLEKAICAREFGIPFYVAAPDSTFDAGAPTGSAIPIEERTGDEIHFQTGPDEDGTMRRVRVTAPGCAALNPAFDVTPARLVSAIITRHRIIDPGEDPFGSPPLSPAPVPV